MRSAKSWTEEGNAHRKRQEWKEAIECYNNALAIDPESEARECRELVIGILEFGNRQMFNV